MTHYADSVRGAFAGATVKPGSVKEVVDERNTGAALIQSTLVLPNGKEVIRRIGVAADGNRVETYDANGRLALIKSSENGEAVFLSGTDGSKAISVVSTRNGTLVTNQGNEVVSDLAFYQQMKDSIAVMSGDKTQVASVSPAVTYRQPASANAGAVPTTRITTVGNTTSIGLEGKTPDIYSGGQKVQHPINGKVTHSEMLSGAEAMNHPSLQNLPEKARQEALRYASAGGVFIVDHVAPAAEAQTAKKGRKIN